MNNFVKYCTEKIKNIPIMLLLVFFFISFIGIALLHLLSYMHSKPWGYNQTKYFFVFILVSFILMFINIKYIYRYSYIFFSLCVVLMIVLLFKGKYAMGAKRWIEIMQGYRFQPSEITKLGLLLFFAKYFHNNNICDIYLRLSAKKNVFGTSLYLKFILFFPFFITIIVWYLIVISPDLGTAIVFLVLSLSIFFLVGYPISYFFYVLGSFIISCPMLWFFLKEYQKKRLIVFFNPNFDIKGAGYNLLQSKIAIGSGGIFGKGIFKGTQSHLKFLPEHQTDFIFSYFAEEFGFVGSSILIILYSLFICFLFRIGFLIQHTFQKIITFGIAILLFIHCFINISMVTGMLPIVGIPLPFLSYGGSMESTLIIGIGLCLNSFLNRKKNLV